MVLFLSPSIWFIPLNADKWITPNSISIGPSYVFLCILALRNGDASLTD